MPSDSSTPHTDVTRLLGLAQAGDRAALDRLMPLVYTELRALADRQLRREHDDRTLHATALVHEVYLKFAGGQPVVARDRAHFLAIAAHAMRQVLVDAARRHNVVMSVGVQWTADPVLRQASDMIKRGDIGHVAQAQTSYYRNSMVGQWRYYPLTRDMNPTTIDWDMFLGNAFSVVPGVPLAPRIPFDRAIFAQWRCYWNFGGGLYTDLFVHRTTRMLAGGSR